jgi:hypothetical protein
MLVNWFLVSKPIFCAQSTTGRDSVFKRGIKPYSMTPSCWSQRICNSKQCWLRVLIQSAGGLQGLISTQVRVPARGGWCGPSWRIYGRSLSSLHTAPSLAARGQQITPGIETCPSSSIGQDICYHVVDDTDRP